ncbi:MAG TPA: M20/M25/M40 family metallo-hydrolase [Vicinamibacterales bacterium]
MDSLDPVAFARELIDIDSTTGREGEAGQWLASRLRREGFEVEEESVEGSRRNVYAHLGQTPTVVLSTHYDCVPPFFPSRIADGRLYGRGACDAKGILAAQVAAAVRLRGQGERRVALLFVVGEERGSDGAATANRTPRGSKYLINGEPTDCRLATSTRGVLRVRLHASGRASHSAAPEQGESAIEKLIDALVQLRAIQLPADPDFGQTHYTVGIIEGGVAPNVVPPSASAEVLFRSVGPPEDILQALRPLYSLIRVEEVLRVPHVRMHTVPGVATASFPFTTDIPLLDRWGKPLLFGPGSFLVAHTDNEYVAIAEIHTAIDAYQRIVSALM